MVDQAQVPIFDFKAQALHKVRAAKNFPNHDFLFRWAAQDCLSRLDLIKRDFKNIAHIGARGAHFYNERFETINCVSGVRIQDGFEILDLAQNSQDLILSTLELHNINDLPGMLIQIRRALKPDGLFLGAMMGGETLFELRQSLTQAELSLKGGASPRVHPFADKQQMGALLQRAGFALPVIDSEILRVTYKSVFKLMEDLRHMGEANAVSARSRANPGKEFFARAAQYYHENYALEDGKIPARFEIIFLLGWAPAESQPQPLKPGSAQNRLADALGTKEVKTPQ